MPVTLIADAVKFIFPAYCANALPVILGGGTPLDFGKLCWDGKPVFGANKTFRGFFAGLTVGTLVGFAESLLFSYDPAWGLTFGFVLSLGALFGDLAESFVKRRLNLPPGASLPVADQLDFVLGALFFSLFIYPPTPVVALIVILITPPIHLLTNWIAYLLGAKKEPW